MKLSALSSSLPSGRVQDTLLKGAVTSTVGLAGGTVRVHAQVGKGRLQHMCKII